MSSGHNSSVATVRQRDGLALKGSPNLVAADEFVALLGPGAISASKDPRSAGGTIVTISTHDGGVTVGGHGHGVALLSVSDRAGADEFVALLGPGAAAVREYPRRAGSAVVTVSTYDGGIAVGGQRHGGALSSVTCRAGAD